MQREISAGGIVVIKQGHTWYVLLMKDKKGNWTFPKGIIEKEEDALNTARREIAEEVGITALSLVSALTPIEYFYYRNGPIKKKVYYYLFRSSKKTKPTVQAEEGIQDARWMPVSLALDTIGYPETNTPVLKEAISHVKT